MNNIAPLTPNDDRIGSADDKNNLIYPGLDAFGNSILLRSTMQVFWLPGGERFICFPANVDISNVDVVTLTGGDGPVATMVFEPELSAHAEHSQEDVDEDSDRDTEDTEVDIPFVNLDEDPVVLNEDALRDMTKAQLLELAGSRGLTVSERMTKQWLIEALTNE